jgi:hypothetical protein
MHRSQILGAAIRQVRRMWLGGASLEEINAFLQLRTPDTWNKVNEALERAFLQRRLIMIRLTPELIEERRSEWEHERISELMRLRDYFSFMHFAQQERVIVTVCAANPAAGQWIGQPGVRCYDGALPVVSRFSPPNEGLLAADPADPCLLELLNGYESPLSYAAYVGLLQTHGLRVASADSGYLLEDVLGLRYHEAYRLHGVYDEKTHEPAWTSKNGERLRGALNRQLGAELVHSGPHDNWELRNERSIAGPFFGPQAPVLVFDHDQYIDERLQHRDLASIYSYHIRWNELYPHHPIPKKSR